MSPSVLIEYKRRRTDDDPNTTTISCKMTKGTDESASVPSEGEPDVGDKPKAVDDNGRKLSLWLDTSEAMSTNRKHDKSQAVLDKRFLTFPEKLMEVLEDESVSDSIKWNEKGDAFGINPEPFISKALKIHFQGTQFESFTRKLNRWGFKRDVDDFFTSTHMVYRHPLFQNGKPELLKRMKGTKTKLVVKGERSNAAGLSATQPSDSSDITTKGKYAPSPPLGSATKDFPGVSDSDRTAYLSITPNPSIPSNEVAKIIQALTTSSDQSTFSPMFQYDTRQTAGTIGSSTRPTGIPVTQQHQQQQNLDQSAIFDLLIASQRQLNDNTVQLSVSTPSSSFSQLPSGLTIQGRLQRSGAFGNMVDSSLLSQVDQSRLPLSLDGFLNSASSQNSLHQTPQSIIVGQQDHRRQEMQDLLLRLLLSRSVVPDTAPNNDNNNTRNG